MTHMFAKKPKTRSNEILKIPQVPTVDQIIEDLEIAKPDDIVFTTDIGLIELDKVQDLHKSSFSLPPRFKVKNTNKTDSSHDLTEKQPDSKELDGLYENVIEFNQNVEKLLNLQQTLPRILDNLSQLHEELSEDKNCVSDTYKQALELHQEINAKEENIN